MKYVFVSDIHGRYDKLAEALAGAQFDPDKDTLVCLGDIFDRGDQSWEVLKYIMGCPNRILIWGNHDYRLRELMLGRDVEHSFDYSNGVLETMKSFCPELKSMGSIGMMIHLFQTDDRYKLKYSLLWKYFNECVWAVEWKNLIATHGWLPHEKIIVKVQDLVSDSKVVLFPNWRNASREVWYDASWAHTEMCCVDNAYPDKQMIVGHWHTWRLHVALDKKPYHLAPFTSYVSEKLIAIDGCSNAEKGVVNAYVMELDEPIAVYNPPRK